MVRCTTQIKGLRHQHHADLPIQFMFVIAGMQDASTGLVAMVVINVGYVMTGCLRSLIGLYSVVYNFVRDVGETFLDEWRI